MKQNNNYMWGNIKHPNSNIKFTFENKYGSITTWTQKYDNAIEHIISNIEDKKHLKGGKILEIDVSYYNNDNKFQKFSIDPAEYQKVLQYSEDLED